MGNDIHDTYHFVTRGVAEEFGKREREIKFNPDLSPEGRDKRLAKNEADRRKEIDKLRASYREAFDKEIAIQDKKLNGKKADYADKARKILNDEMIKSVNFAELDTKHLSFDDNARAGLLINVIENGHKERMAFEKAKAKSMRDIEWIRGDIQKAINDGDVEKLEEYQQVAELLPNGKDSDSLIAILTPAIDKAKLDKMTPSQREALDAKGRLEHSKSLLEAEFESVAERGQYMGYRHANKEQPVNTLTYVGGSDRVLGKSPIQRQFSQYKTNK